LGLQNLAAEAFAAWTLALGFALAPDLALALATAFGVGGNSARSFPAFAEAGRFNAGSSASESTVSTVSKFSRARSDSPAAAPPPDQAGSLVGRSKIEAS